MLRIAICDDEEKITKQLKLYVKEYAKEKCVGIEINCYTNPFKLLAKSSLCDLIFLDIDMPEMNGLEIGTKIKEQNSKIEIIYVTSYSDYAYRSFAVRPFGYVVKPFSKDDIFKEMNDYISKKEKNDSQKISMSDGKTALNLNADDILYFQYSTDKYVNIVLDNKTYDMRCSLKYFHDKVSAYGFTYPHKSFVVNMIHIEKIDSFELIMKNDIVIPIAQKRKAQFMEEYNLFLQNALGDGKVFRWN